MILKKIALLITLLSCNSNVFSVYAIDETNTDISYEDENVFTDDGVYETLEEITATDIIDFYSDFYLNEEIITPTIDIEEVCSTFIFLFIIAKIIVVIIIKILLFIKY